MDNQKFVIENKINTLQRNIAGLTTTVANLTLSDIDEPTVSFDMNNQNFTNVGEINSDYVNIGMLGNLINYSNDFTSAGWNSPLGGNTFSNLSEVGKDGVANTASSLAISNIFRLPISLTESTTYTFSIYVKYISGSASLIIDYGDNATATLNIATDGNWYRYSFTGVWNANPYIDFVGTGTFHIADAQIVEGSEAGLYTETNGSAFLPFSGISCNKINVTKINLIPSTNAVPENGDIWNNGTDLKFRIGGVTKTITTS